MNGNDREKQIQQAEEMFGDSLKHVGFAKGLYFGRYLGAKLLPYPDLHADQRVNDLVEELKQFCATQIDPERIDREQDIPADVIAGLGRLGVLGACLPTETGGLGLSQVAYCRLLEVLGSHCASTALFVNAHHSIGPRAVVLFGTPEQKARWLPKMTTGEWISAFALTEPEAGSDAGNVQTQATPTPDGSGWILNGQKRYITNGALAKVLTVMARTPVPGSAETKVSAFIVTPDMPGFEVVEARMPKCGVRGTATSRLAFRDMFVPKENLLGQLGRGLKVALTVLDFGRTTFGASCTGAAKFCLARSAAHANTRVQFGQKLGNFELVKEKLAYMAASVFAMEAMTYQTAALIDSGSEDYMLETAMLKVFATERLWRIVNDALQIHGGAGYFNDLPFERMMRDHRIDLIGEGANDVLRAFIALVGMRDVGMELEGILNALKHPFSNFGRLSSFAARRIGSMILSPEVTTRTTELENEAGRLGNLIGMFGAAVERLLRKYQQEILDRQYLQARIADAACELYASSCVLSRLDAIVRDHHLSEDQKRRDLKLGRYYLATADRRARQCLEDLWDNDDDETTVVADAVLAWQQAGLLQPPCP